MKNILLEIEYDATKYRGWQGNKNKAMTVEGKIQGVLSRLVEGEVEIITAVKLEAGVHAYGQLVNSKIEVDRSAEDVKKYLNHYLPKDIRIVDAKEVEERVHCMLNKKALTYEYHINMGAYRNVLETKYCMYCNETLDLEKMKHAAQCYIGSHDVNCFNTNKKMKKSTIRKIEEIQLEQIKNQIVITIKLDEVWPNLIINLISSIVAVGRGILEMTDIKAMLELDGSQKDYPKVEAKGLFLKKVHL